MMGSVKFKKRVEVSLGKSKQHGHTRSDLCVEVKENVQMKESIEVKSSIEVTASIESKGKR